MKASRYFVTALLSAALAACGTVDTPPLEGPSIEQIRNAIRNDLAAYTQRIAPLVDGRANRFCGGTVAIWPKTITLTVGTVEASSSGFSAGLLVPFGPQKFDPSTAKSVSTTRTKAYVDVIPVLAYDSRIKPPNGYEGKDETELVAALKERNDDMRANRPVSGVCFGVNKDELSSVTYTVTIAKDITKSIGFNILLGKFNSSQSSSTSNSQTLKFTYILLDARGVEAKLQSDIPDR